MNYKIRKILIEAFICTAAASAVTAPTAAVAFADDNIAIESENINNIQTSFKDTEGVWIDIDDENLADEFVVVEIENEDHEKKTKTEKLDRSRYGETLYANVADYLTLRSRATSGSSELERLAPNTKMTIVGTVGDWVKVYVPSVDKNGFVYSQYVSSEKR